jgi:hypothetical protein
MQLSRVAKRVTSLTTERRFVLISKGYPCGHALAVLLGKNKPIKDYIRSYFTVKYFQYTYSGSIVHPHTMDFAAPLEFNCCSHSHSDLSDDDGPDSTLPHTTRRPPGRPPKHRIRTSIETTDAASTKLQKCSRCEQLTTHNERTCTEPIVQAQHAGTCETRPSHGRGRGHQGRRK